MATFAGRFIPAPRVKLTNTAWDEIANAFELGPEARDRIDSAVSFFEAAETVLVPNNSPAATKKALQNLADLASELRGGLQTLVGNPLAMVCFTKGTLESSMDNRAAQAVFAAEIAALSTLEQSLRTTISAVVKSGGGAHRQAVRVAMFVKLLDQILFGSTGRNLKRDSKGKATGRDFIAAITNAYRLKIGRGSIDDALKQVIKGRG
jgi:hypothetical protein